MVGSREEHERVTRSRFDDWSETNTFQRLRPWLMFVQENVLREIDWTRTRRVLDVACGSGWLVYEAARRLPDVDGALACGCDLSTGMLDKRERSSSAEAATARFVAASAQNLSFDSGAFDAVMCTAAFHHFPKPHEALLEFRRVLRPGGVVLISDSCRDVSIGNWVWDRLHRWFEKGHVKYYRRNELTSLLERAGFEQTRIFDLNPSFAETKKLARRISLFKAVAP
jgi:ubiquinone/menaquinone biosynthesis C-methylase UbiE